MRRRSVRFSLKPSEAGAVEVVLAYGRKPVFPMATVSKVESLKSKV